MNSIKFSCEHDLSTSFLQIVDKLKKSQRDHKFVDLLHFTPEFIEFTNSYFIVRYRWTENELKMLDENETFSEVDEFCLTAQTFNDLTLKETIGDVKVYTTYVAESDFIFDSYPNVQKVIDDAMEKGKVSIASYAFNYLERFMKMIHKCYTNKERETCRIFFSCFDSKYPSFIRCLDFDFYIMPVWLFTTNRKENTKESI